jgi:glycosyltransferase involved in cell wall biosynthesis
MTTLSVVIPAYNEEKGIEDIILRVLSVEKILSKAGVGLEELLVVDDASKDRTAKLRRIARIIPACASSAMQRTKAMVVRSRRASPSAGDLVGFWMQTGPIPEYFPQLCQKAMEGADVVIGSRMAGAKARCR